MEHIHNYLTLSVEAESSKEIEATNWLSHAHYIYAIDHERNAILVFNIPNWLISHLSEKFGISEWRFEESPNPPKHYIKLFRFIDWHLFENVSNYRWFAQREDFRAFSTIAERYVIMDAAYYHDGYSAWRLRYYLSRRLMGMSAKNPRHCYYYDEDSEEIALLRKTVIPPLAETQKKLNVPSTIRYPIDLDIWLDRDRLYIGWFVNDLYVYSFRGLFEKLNVITNEMNPWFEKNGYSRNTRDQSEIDSFLARLRQHNLKD
ncbi:MAG: hypothetical protein HDS00_03960 [Bacteroides sp.]|nr:hypothetical protein [Bacteroides sp.]